MSSRSSFLCAHGLPHARLRWSHARPGGGEVSGALMMIAATVATALVLFLAPAQPAPVLVADAAPQPTNARERFAVDVLAGLGNTSPTPATVRMIVEWTIAEDAGDGALTRHNPLNTTQSGYNETHAINDDGVRGYATYADGLAATLQTLSYGYYTAIVAALRANDPEAAKRALWASPWASSHYGYGAAWPKGE